VDAPGEVWTAALVAWIAAIPLWRFTKYAITIAHEGGHAFFATILGQAVHSIKVFRTGGGVTDVGTVPWAADVILTLAGYLGPSLIGLGGTWLLLTGRPTWVLWISFALLLAVLLKMRSFFSVLAVFGTGGIIYWMARYAEPPAQLTFAYIWVWFLLIGGVRQMSDLFWVTRGGSRTSDPAVLQRLTWVPDVLWLGVFWLSTLAALVWGGALLLRFDV